MHFAPLTSICLALGLALGTSCGNDDPAQPESGTASSQAARRESSRPVAQEVGDLIAALTPPPEAEGSGPRDEYHRRRRITMQRMQSAGVEVGEAVLKAYLEKDHLILPVRQGLLEVAAINAPQATEPILVQLITLYGEDLGLRELAARLLGQVAPQRAIEVIKPLLFDRTPSTTYPPDESLLMGWIDACAALDMDPSRDLGRLATDMGREGSVRGLALKTLGTIDSKIGRAALEEVLVESSGNLYLRRLAAQSLVQVVESKELCTLMQVTFEREADPMFKLFLADVIQKNCQ